MHAAKLAFSAAGVVAVVLSGAPGRAETTNCTAVTALPAVIGAPGVYCLTSDLSTSMTSGTAITIQSDDVVLDLNDHLLKDVPSIFVLSPTQAVGIGAVGRHNITIRNGTVRGFNRGIYLQESYAHSSGHLIERVRTDQSGAIGIVVYGVQSVVRNNIVTNSGVTLGTGNGSGVGIMVWGSGNRVIENDVLTVSGGSQPYGIYIQDDGTYAGFAAGNRISGAVRGIDMPDTGTVKYRDNLTLDVSTPYWGGVDAGNNN